MSVRFDATADKVTRTTNLPPITAFTIMGWFQLVVDRNAYSSFFCFGSGDANIHLCGANGDGVTLFMYNPGGGEVASSALTVGQWYHVAMTVAGTGANQAILYRDGTAVLTIAGSAVPTAATLWIGTNNGNEHINGRVAAIKVWSAALTANEVQQEMRCYMPLRTANLNTWSPMMASTAMENLAGTGVWTVAGTLVTETGPPIAWAPQQRWGGLPQAAAVAATLAPPPRLRPWRFVRRAA